jgi:hypothetical protein
MFNLFSEVNRLQQLKHDKVHGLPYKPKHYDSKVNPVSDIPYETDAQREGMFISNSFKNHSRDFGKRLSKRKGEYHRPGGGFHLATIKGG